MVTDTQTQPRGDLAAQQAYFARLFNEEVDQLRVGKSVDTSVASARERLAALNRLPVEYTGTTLRHGGETEGQYTARRKADQKMYTSQIDAVKKALMFRVA